MKVCENCGKEIDGGDGDNLCPTCDLLSMNKQALIRQRARQRRRDREEVLRSCGLVKVKGALGGTYWE